MDYQFIIIGCSLATAFFVILILFIVIKAEINNLKRTLIDQNNETNINIDKIDTKLSNNLKDLNLRMDAMYSKLDNLLWRFLNKSQ